MFSSEAARSGRKRNKGDPNVNRSEHLYLKVSTS